MNRQANLLAASLFLLIVLCCLSSCNSHKDQLKKERKEMEKFNQSLKTDVYRSIKISLRSLPVNELSLANLTASDREDIIQSQKRDLPAVKLYSLAYHIFQVNHPDPESKPGVVEYILIAREVMQIRKLLNTLDEDDFPTILSNFALLSADISGADLSQTLLWYNSDFEHLMLATLWMSSPLAPEEFGIYEMTRLDPEKINLPEVQLLTYALRSGFFYKQDWFYHSEQEASLYLDLLKKNRTFLTAYFNSHLIPGTTVETEAQAYAQLHCLGVCMRGFARLKIEENRKALRDFNAFMEDAEIIGLEDEGVWLIGAYVSIQNEQWDQANAFLNALSASSWFSTSDKELIAQVQRLVRNKEADQAAQLLMNKVLIAKIISRYIASSFARIEWQEKIRNNELGAAFLTGMQSIDQEITSISSYFEGEKLTQEALEFKEGAEKKLGGLARTLWEDAGNLVDSASVMIDSLENPWLQDSTVQQP